MRDQNRMRAARGEASVRMRMGDLKEQSVSRYEIRNKGLYRRLGAAWLVASAMGVDTFNYNTRHNSIRAQARINEEQRGFYLQDEGREVVAEI